MAWATYTARRDLAPLHFTSTEYTIPLALTQEGFVPRHVDLKVRNEMLTGRVETIYHGRKRIWHVILEPVEEGDAALIREFLGSTADGQQFSFDPIGSIDAPVREMLVVREDDGATEDPWMRAGDPAGTDLVQFSFDIRQVE